MSAETIANTILLFISIISFVYLYNKGVKNRVDQSDLRKLETYVDKRDDELDVRIDKIEECLRKDITEIRQMSTDILKILIDKK